VAKKTRTPPPPRRPVQSPQRRASKTERTPQDRRRMMLLVLFAASGIIALGVVIAVIMLVGGGGGSSSGESVASEMRAAGCTVQTAAAKSRKHVTSLDAKIKYNTDPPSNGSHYITPAIWDFYPTPANPIQVVHNEEHGGVILWWGDKVPASTVDKLRAFYSSSPDGMLGTPLASLGNKVAITAWTAPQGENGEGHAAVCPTFDEKAFEAFRDAYRGKGPERFPVDSLTPGT
jgi:hypothetical protein